MKIEQQEEKYKAKQSAKYILVKKSYIYSYKVKEAKIRKLELLILSSKEFNIQLFESLILAQDERWRRA